MWFDIKMKKKQNRKNILFLNNISHSNLKLQNILTDHSPAEDHSYTYPP